MIGKRLPRLRGAFLTAYRLLWILLFACGLLSNFYIQPRDEIHAQARTRAAYALGFVTYLNPSMEGQMGGPFGEAGRRMGYRDGDLLLSVDGRRVTDDPAAQAALLAGPPGSVATLLVRHPTGETVTLRVARDPTLEQRSLGEWGIPFGVRRGIQFAFYDVAELLLLAAAALLLVRRPHDPVAQLLGFSLVLGGFSVSTLLPQVPSFASGVQSNVAEFAMIAAVLCFPGGRPSSRWHWLALSLYALTGVIRLGAYWFSSFQPFAAAYGVAPAALLIAMIVQLRRTPPGEARQQAKFVLFGVVSMAIFALLQSLFLVLEQASANQGIVGWFTLAKHLCNALSSLAMAAGLLASVLRFRLYDADAVISRSAAYAFLTLMLGAAFAGSEKVIEVLGEEFFGEGSRALAAGLGAAVAAVLIAPLHNRVHHWTEKRFQRALVRLRRSLPLRVADMREFATLDELLSAVAGEVERATHATRVAILIGEPGGAPALAFVRQVSAPEVAAWQSGWQPGAAHTLDCDRADPLFPARLRLHADGAGTVGWLLAGPRPDGSFYGKDEREALAEIADPVARAIHIVRQRATLNERVFGRIHSLEREVARLMDVLAGMGRPSIA